MNPFRTHGSVACPKQSVFLCSEGGGLARKGRAGKGEFEGGYGRLTPPAGVGVLGGCVVIPGDFCGGTTGEHDGVNGGVGFLEEELLLVLLLGGGGEGGGGRGGGGGFVFQCGGGDLT